MEFALTYVTDVANFHGVKLYLLIWLPQCVSKGRICTCKSFAIDIVVGQVDQAAQATSDRTDRTGIPLKTNP